VLSYGITVSATHVARRRRRSKFVPFFVVPLPLFVLFYTASCRPYCTDT